MLEVFRGVDVGRGEDGFGAEFADAGLGEGFLIARDLVGLALADAGFDLAAALIDIGAEDIPGGAEEAFTFIGREMVEEGAVVDDGFEGGEGVSERVGVGVGIGHGRILKV